MFNKPTDGLLEILAGIVNGDWTVEWCEDFEIIKITMEGEPTTVLMEVEQTRHGIEQAQVHIFDSPPLPDANRATWLCDTYDLQGHEAVLEFIREGSSNDFSNY